MPLIKLDAIDSTNEFLKSLSTKQDLENFTVVTAENQTNGKGQMGAVWKTEIGKNLIMSVLVKEFINSLDQVFELNMLFSVSTIQVLDVLEIPSLSIKWPNDIMSDNKKIGGILIENILKYDKSIESIIGLGLNVNQISFESLPKASSIAIATEVIYDKEEILIKIINQLMMNYKLWFDNSQFIKEFYSNRLFKRGKPMPFQNQLQQKFMGIIKNVSVSGKLEVLLEDNSVVEFDTKEVKLLY